jgi:Polyketide cyclase / dehydrase and lipid transport
MTKTGSTTAEIVRTDTHINVDLSTVWAAVREVYAADKYLFPGIITAIERDGDMRTVILANGLAVKERILSVDDTEHRIAYSAFGGNVTHHLSTMQVLPEASGCTVIWISEILPVELKGIIEDNMAQGSALMKQTLEA